MCVRAAIPSPLPPRHHRLYRRSFASMLSPCRKCSCHSYRFDTPPRRGGSSRKGRRQLHWLFLLPPGLLADRIDEAVGKQKRNNFQRDRPATLDTTNNIGWWWMSMQQPSPRHCRYRFITLKKLSVTSATSPQDNITMSRRQSNKCCSGCRDRRTHALEQYVCSP